MSSAGADDLRGDTLRLPAEPDNEAVIRQYVRLACHHLRRDTLLERTLLVTDELVGNAIRHAANPGERFVEVGLERTARGLRVAVRDGDPTPPRLLHPGLDDTAGRGLQVVSAIATEWGCRPAPDGKTVWADIDPR